MDCNLGPRLSIFSILSRYNFTKACELTFLLLSASITSGKEPARIPVARKSVSTDIGRVVSKIFIDGEQPEMEMPAAKAPNSKCFMRSLFKFWWGN